MLASFTRTAAQGPALWQVLSDHVVMKLCYPNDHRLGSMRWWRQSALTDSTDVTASSLLCSLVCLVV